MLKIKDEKSFVCELLTEKQPLRVHLFAAKMKMEAKNL